MLVSEKLKFFFRLFEKKTQKMSAQEEYEEKPKVAIDGAKPMVRTADKKLFQRKLISTQVNSQRSPQKERSLNEHIIKGRPGKYVIATEIEREKGRKRESRKKRRKHYLGSRI